MYNRPLNNAGDIIPFTAKVITKYKNLLPVMNKYRFNPSLSFTVTARVKTRFMFMALLNLITFSLLPSWKLIQITLPALSC